MSKFENNEENQAKMQAVGSYLLGTTLSLEDGLAEEFGEDIDLMDFDTELLRELDDITMLCDSCGWWCETGELNDNQECDDCIENEDED